MRELLDHCEDLPVVELAPGDVLIEQGQAPGALHVLVEGELRVERDGVAFARVNAPGAIFGEMSVLIGEPATASVVAATPCRLRRAVDGEAFLSSHPQVALAIARTNADRLNNLTKYLADVKLQFADQGGHLGMVDGVLNVLVHHQAPKARTGSSRQPDPEY